MSSVIQLDRALKQTDQSCPSGSSATPFIKWAGGKRSLIPEIAKHIPDRVSTYWEPFVGGGAVFFAFVDRFDRAYLSDKNEDLILTYQIVRDRVGHLIEALQKHESNHRKEYYYLKVRAQDPKDALDIAARFIYLNKTCYNGLYRVNNSGKFNVPKGNYKNPDICNVERLESASKALKKATIKFGDFEKRVSPSEGDLIYCDPPYHETFTGYQAGGFNSEDQERLRDCVKRWKSSGATVMVSSSDTPLIRDLYQEELGFDLNETQAPRNINTNGNGRGAVPELIIA